MRAVQVIPPSWVASRITWWLDVAAATRQLSSSVHDRAVTASPTVQVRGVGTDQVVAASLVKARRELPVMPVVSTTAHVASAKQSMVLTPRPACGAVATINDSLSYLDFRKHKPDAKLKIAATDTGGASDASGVLLRKGSPALVAAIDKALADIKADGTYAKISQKYFGRDVSQP